MQNHFNGGTPGNGSKSFEHLQFYNDVGPAVRGNRPPSLELTGMRPFAWIFSTQQSATEGTRSSKQQKNRIGLDREKWWGGMVLIKPLAQWELHPHAEHHKLLRSQAKCGPIEPEDPDGKVKQIKWFRLVASKEKKRDDKDNSLCWTACTTMNWIWI